MEDIQQRIEKLFIYRDSLKEANFDMLIAKYTALSHLDDAVEMLKQLDAEVRQLKSMLFQSYQKIGYLKTSRDILRQQLQDVKKTIERIAFTKTTKKQLKQWAEQELGKISLY